MAGVAEVAPRVARVSRPTVVSRSSPRRTWRGWLGPLLFVLVTTVFTWKLLFTGLVVIGYDTMVYMYPYRYFAAMALREGHLPFWNPFIFYGVPFLANLQSAVFYPLHVLFLIAHPTTAMNWSVALHLFLTCLTTYLAARGIVGLDRLGAVVAGALFGLGGFVGSQVGHLNQLNAVAWLPLALLTLHHALTRRQARWVAATGLTLAIQLLAGHAQESFMTVVALASYAVYWFVKEAWQAHLRPAAITHDEGEAEGRVHGHGRARAFLLPAKRLLPLAKYALWGFLALGISGTLAGGIAAAQLLPTNQLTGLSIRAKGMSLGEASSFSLPPRELFVGVLPAFGLAYPTSNEYLGWIGFGGLTLMLFGVVFGLYRPPVVFFFLLSLATFLLALGNHFPLYEMVFGLPGMHLFRVPARWLMLTSLANAMVAGAGMMFIRQLGARGWMPLPGAGAPPAPAGPWQRLIAATRLLLAVGIVGALVAVVWPMQRVGMGGQLGPVPAQLVGVWLALAGVSALLAFWALAAAPSRLPSVAFTAFVLAELFVASRSLEYNNPNPARVYTAITPTIELLQRSMGPQERFLSIAATGYHPSNAKQLVEGHEPLLGPDGVLATLINTKYKEILTPNLPMVFGVPSVDGYDGGVLPLRRYVDYKSLVVPPEKNLPDSLLRDQFQRVPSAQELRRLGANYVVVDAISDVTRDGVYFDLAGTVALDPGQRAVLDRFATSIPSVGEHQSSGVPAATASVAGPVTSVGLVTTLEGAVRVSQGTPVATVALGQTRGGQQRILWQGQLLAGRDTAEGVYSPAVQHAQPPPLGPAAATANATSLYPARLSVPDIGPVDWVAVQNLLAAERGRVNVHAITLVGADGSAVPVTLAGNGELRLVLKSDVKIYQVESALPRAYVTPRAVITADPAAALAVLGAPEHDPRGAVVLERAAELEVSGASFRRRVRRALEGIFSLLGISRDAQLGAVGGALERELAGTIEHAGALNAAQRAGAGSVEWLVNTPEHLALRVTLDTSGFLVLRDTLYPGWSVRVDGNDAPLLRGDYLFRAVPLSAGTHQVEFVYRSLPFERGLVISLLALVATVIVALLPVPRWLRDPAGGS